MPTPSQRCAPLTSMPMIGTSSRQHQQSPRRADARPPRGLSRGSIETPIITGTRRRDPDQLAHRNNRAGRRDVVVRIAPRAAGEAAATAISADARSGPAPAPAARGRSPRTSARRALLVASGRSASPGAGLRARGAHAATSLATFARAASTAAAEGVAARLVILELVERGAGRRQQDHLARPGAAAIASRDRLASASRIRSTGIAGARICANIGPASPIV